MNATLSQAISVNSKVTQVVSCGPVGNASNTPHRGLGLNLDLPKGCFKWFRLTGVKQTIPSGFKTGTPKGRCWNIPPYDFIILRYKVLQGSSRTLISSQLPSFLFLFFQSGESFWMNSIIFGRHRPGLNLKKTPQKRLRFPVDAEGFLGGAFAYFALSSLFGEDLQFDEHIFRMGGSTTKQISIHPDTIYKLGSQLLIRSKICNM